MKFVCVCVLLSVHLLRLVFNFCILDDFTTFVRDSNQQPRTNLQRYELHKQTRLHCYGPRPSSGKPGSAGAIRGTVHAVTGQKLSR